VKQIVVDKKTIIHVGGSIEQAIKGQYQLNIKAIFTEAWQLTLQRRRVINSALLIIFLLSLIVTQILISFLGGAETVLQSPVLTMALNILLTLFIWPLLAGVEMMGLLHSVAIKTRVGLIWSFMSRGSAVALCALMTSLLTSLGLELLLIPGIFLAIIFSLSVLLVVEKQLSPWQSIVTSIKSLRYSWLKLLQLYGFLAMLAVLSFLPVFLLRESPMVILALVLFFVVMSYLAPLFYHCKGIVYREVFGLQFEQLSAENMESNIFNA
jgi:hypothetical protein